MKIPSFINRAKCKRFLLEYAQSNRAHRFTRVSAETLDMLEAKMKLAMAHWVDQMPSKGKTL